jgi:uncharacterized secreted protein with C-terminal beta-propeller domain
MQTCMRSRWLSSGFCWLACGLALAACNDDPATPAPGVDGDGASDFVSSLTNGSGQGVNESDGGDSLSGGAGGSSAGAPTASPGAAQDAGNSGAERAIAEADILQLDGDRIYALSQFTGLSIIDAANPRALRLEGSYRSTAIPFEMYVEDGIVFAMFNSYYSYECDEVAQSCSWQSTSRMQAIDARDPANIVRLSDYEVPGTISDSRRVGDILYLATHEDGYCWGCDSSSATVLTSFDASDITALARVDQLRFADPKDVYAGQRSISVTQDRIYISGSQWSTNGTFVAGSVQVVDISDPSGAIVAGATVPIAGQIQSRWQMDEFDGVLRVISQPGGWGSQTPAVLETFRVDDASDVQRLARLTIQLPRPNEVLQSARFDGARAYAITAERVDPLFTFDLSDPANPRQVGELEMPGFVYHMEPRGDRLFALGFDNANEAGSLHVSLFDVSNLSQPVLLSRVPFGGDWGSFAEDQDRIHKAFSILDDSGLILVPFAGGTYDEATCNYEYGSGIQLVDFTNDSLTKRGVAPQVGTARRALLHRDYLFGIGDNAVQTFDISDRDAPAPAGRLDVARNVSTVRVLGDHLLRFGSDWWTNQTTLDLTPIAQASVAEPEAEVDLGALFGENTWSCGRSSEWTGQVFSKGDYAYVPRYSYRWDVDGQNNGNYQQRLTFYVIDLSDRSNPRPIGTIPIEPVTSNGYFNGITQTENTLLVGRSTGYYEYDYYGNRTGTAPRYFYDVIDLSEPGVPSVVKRFEVPEALSAGGYGYYNMGGCTVDMAWGWYGGGYSTGTLTDGDLVISQHSVPVPGRPGQVRYYLDRIDVSNPTNPVILPAVNIPGNVVNFNAETGELVTVDYQESLETFATYDDCYNRGAWGYFDSQSNRCRVQRRSINGLVLEGDRAVRVSQVLLDRDQRTSSIAVSDSRVFYTTSDFPNPSVNGAVSLSPVTLNTLRIDGGSLQALAPVDLGSKPYYWGDLRARGDRVFEISDSKLTVVDTADGEAPAQKSFELPGYSYCASLEVSGDAAFCAMYQRGVEVFDLTGMR